MSDFKVVRDDEGQSMIVNGFVTVRHDRTTDMIGVSCEEHGKLKAYPDGIFLPIAQKDATDHVRSHHSD